MPKASEGVFPKQEELSKPVDGQINALVDETLPKEDQPPAPPPEPVVPKSGEPPAPAPVKTPAEPPADLLGVIQPKEEKSATEPREETPPEGLSEKQGEAWKTMRLRIRELENAQGKKTDADAETLRKELADAHAKLERADLASSPRFLKEFVTPISTLQQKILEVGKEYGIEPSILGRAASLGTKERSELLKREATADTALYELLPLYQQLGLLGTRRDQALKEFRETREALAQQELGERRKLVESRLPEIQQRLSQTHYLLSDSKLDPEWLPRMMRGALRLLTGEATLDERIEAALKAQPVDYYVARIQQLTRNLEQANRHLGRKMAATPKIDARGGDTSPPAPKQAGSLDELAESVIPTE